MKTQYYASSGNNSTDTGFTLMEVLAVVLVVGILSAIAAPSWINFINFIKLEAAQDRVYAAMQKAKANATRDKVTWQASFRETTIKGESIVQWAVHPASIDPTNAIWNNFEREIRLDPETTFPETNGIHRALFNYYGCPVYNAINECGKTSLRALGRLTLSLKAKSNLKRCVFVSTLIGAIRKAQENPKPQDGKYCY